jgi:glycosyltransferase 2 family protein
VTERSTSQRRWLIWSLRIAAFLIVIWFAGKTVGVALDRLSQYEWQLQPAWLVAAGVLYIVGLVPMAWFWHRTLAALGQPAPWGATLRAYFLGHLGKYVPGKAMAVVLRIAAVQKWVPAMRIAIISVMLETLTMMAVGAFLAAALAAYLLRSRPEQATIALLTAIAVGVPTLPPIIRRFARIGVKAEDVATSFAGINFRLLFEGWSAALLCWLFLGLSLWATLRAIGVEQLSPVHDLPRLVAAVALAVVAGFVSMLPGGLGVRDLALVRLLSETCGPTNALVAAILLRLVWLVSESTACVILYIAARLRR